LHSYPTLLYTHNPIIIVHAQNRLAIIQTVTGIHYVHEYRTSNTICEQSPCFLFPLSSSLLLPFVPFYLLGTLLAVIGSCPPRSQVARKLTFPFPCSTPYTPHSEIPTPWGSPKLNIHFTKTTSRTWVTRSRTVGKWCG
jgi:hypothetical protein